VDATGIIKSKWKTPRNLVGLGIVLLGLMAMTIFCASTLYHAYAQNPDSYERSLALQRQAHVSSGLLVVSTDLFSKARRVGLIAGDIITRYNGDIVVDYPSYRKAVAKNVEAGATGVTMRVMRAGRPMELQAPPGLLGFDTGEWSQLREEIMELVAERQFDRARIMFEKAVSTGELSEYDLLISRISLIPDRDDTQDRQRFEMLNELLSRTPDGNLGWLAGVFYKAHLHKAAALFHEADLEVNPSDISVRTNLALTYAQGGRFDDAERMADELLSQYKGSLSSFGQSVALKAKALALDGRRDYRNAVILFRQALEKAGNREDFNLRMRYLLSLARLKNLSEFEEGVRFCNQHPQEVLPQRPFYVDSLRAYILVENGEKERAVQLVDKWRGDANALRRVAEYWNELTNSDDIAKHWAQLLNEHDRGDLE